jgi:NADH-quinone oxidoreductase subunit C
VAESSNHSGADSTAPDFSRLAPTRRDLLDRSQEIFAQYNPQPGVLGDLPQVTVEPENVLEVCRLAKDDPELDFKLLLCLTCVDYRDRIQMVYFLHSLTHEQTLVIKADAPYEKLRVPSVTPVWRAADWYEREAHDLFGMEFEGHPDLAPLLLYEEFEGYPGRKEFPFYEYQEF